MDRDAGIETKGHLLGYSSLELSSLQGSCCSHQTPQETPPSVCLQADGLTYCRSTRIGMCFSLVLPCKKQALQLCLPRAQEPVHPSASPWPFPCLWCGRVNHTGPFLQMQLGTVSVLGAVRSLPEGGTTWESMPTSSSSPCGHSDEVRGGDPAARSRNRAGVITIS